MTPRAFVGAALLLFAPAAARAQFAGVVAPPPRREGQAPLTPAQSRVQRDSIRREAMSDMRAWVDSAAGVVIVAPRTPAPPGRDPASTPDTTRTKPATPADSARRPPRSR